MVAILVLATFIIFILVDYYLQRRQPQPVEAAEVVAGPEETWLPHSMVGGFKLPANLSYHPGHAWAMNEGRHMVRAGLDDFAARLVGMADRIEVPARGHWLRQGEKAWTLVRGNHRFEMLSPIEGEVIDVNPEVANNPALLLHDPYGAGWLVAVQAPAADANMKNLLHGRLAQRWMEESVATLYSKINGHSGVHLQDGGRAVPDILAQVPEEQWEKVVRDMLLT